MNATFGTEILKLRKRPSTWTLGLIFMALTVLFGYLLSYLLIVGAGGDAPPEAEAFLPTLYPENVLTNVLQMFAQFGVAVTLILGAMAVGSEYGWETLKFSLTQRPGKLPFFAGKLLAVGVVLALFTPVVFAVGALSSYVVAGLRDVPVDWPPLWEAAKALGVGWLILAVFAAMGVFLATLFRGTGLAIGLGLVYLLVLESLFLGLPIENETFQNIGKALPGRNAFDLTLAFGDAPQAFPMPGGTIEPTQATLVLAAYLAGFLVLAALIFRRREVK